MAIGDARVQPRSSRVQSLIDRSLPIAALAAIGFFSVVLCVLLLRVAGDAFTPPFSAAYTAGQNPWIAVTNRPTLPADAVAFGPAQRNAH
jgi:hypothetical protein